MNPRFSVVAPVYNEEQLVEKFYQRVRAVMEGLGEPWELVLINDGCRDKSPELMDAIYAQDPEHVVVIHFARNFGHQIAITAGMDHARGDAIVVIDSDLQDPPEVIPELIAKWREGYEVVYAVRTEREGETWFKLFTARLFYRIIQALTDVVIPMEAGDFRLLDRNALEALKRMRERHRFVRAMVSWIGFRQTGVPYKRHARAAGETKYPFKKMFRLALDAITGFSFFPLKLTQWAGLVAVMLGLLLALVLFIIRLGGAAPLAGQGLTASLVLFMGGVQLLGIGILGEYIGRIYDEVRDRPLYIVREIKGQESANRESANERICE
ncbi:MAG TPA: glycosyltransferase family 2 protein [Anaerolineae bacterium]|nr:glycosyltransferase family 2 protein [Anaerolineae bacterium]HQK13595.1 glycosyltransferase family 2 protein [Anaerolineae bacterium]